MLSRALVKSMKLKVNLLHLLHDVVGHRYTSGKGLFIDRLLGIQIVRMYIKLWLQARSNSERFISDMAPLTACTIVLHVLLTFYAFTKSVVADEQPIGLPSTKDSESNQANRDQEPVLVDASDVIPHSFWSDTKQLESSKDGVSDDFYPISERRPTSDDIPDDLLPFEFSSAADEDGGCFWTNFTIRSEVDLKCFGRKITNVSKLVESAELAASVVFL